MALISCPECGAEVSDRAAACPHCGCPLTRTVPASSAAAYRYPCPFCDEGFDEGTDLYRHKKEEHYRKGSPPPVWVEKPAAGEDGQPTIVAGWARWTLSPAIVCPHCQTVGQVSTRRYRAKKGISGGKATAAVLTAGLSLFVAGLSRKEDVTEARCGNCQAVWAL